MVLGPLELIELDTRVEPYPYTCRNCKKSGDFSASSWLEYEERYFRPGDDVSAHARTVHDLEDPQNIKNPERDFLPDRCPPCNRDYCKYKNTKKQIYKLTEYCFQRRGQYAKMITVGLRSKWNDPRDKFTQIEELKRKWKKLYKFLVDNSLVTGGIYVMEVTQKVSFDGHTHYYKPDSETWDYQKIGEPDLSGLVKFHCHIHAVVDMPTFRGRNLSTFSEIGNKFGLGRISVTYAKRDEPHWLIKHKAAKYLAKYISKDYDCGRQAAFGKFRGFKMPQPFYGKDSTLSSYT